eukprot:CAMPEP_0184474850 /NCGR_PEP_ID=MMETSP0740-20130409/139564_1 /TAXON_ID=385413 /ORGANISM="Thalassiosira miniscula, Strain CCMP1093" /LENGTH=38 /DNA_ID= /DNA_START= /DNA_END= /DNA_ORIENTATION=
MSACENDGWFEVSCEAAKYWAMVNDGRPNRVGSCTSLA